MTVGPVTVRIAPKRQGDAPGQPREEVREEGREDPRDPDADGDEPEEAPDRCARAPAGSRVSPPSNRITATDRDTSGNREIPEHRVGLQLRSHQQPDRQEQEDRGQPQPPRHPLGAHAEDGDWRRAGGGGASVDKAVGRRAGARTASVGTREGREEPRAGVRDEVRAGRRGGAVAA